MVKFSFEKPLCLMESNPELDDYDYCLCHLLENESYYDYFKNRKRYTIMDNSVYELGKAFGINGFIKYIEDIKPDEYIIPDVLNDRNGTIDNCEKFLFECGDVSGKKIFVIQGETIQHMIECYRYASHNDKIDKIAIPFGSIAYQNYFKEPFSSEKSYQLMVRALGRRELIGELYRCGLWCDKPHHLLGHNSMWEYAFSETDCGEGRYWSNIESIDTSSPIMFGLNNQRYDSHNAAFKYEGKMCDAMFMETSEITEGMLTCIKYNIDYFKKLVNKTCGVK